MMDFYLLHIARTSILQYRLQQVTNKVHNIQWIELVKIFQKNNYENVGDL